MLSSNSDDDRSYRLLVAGIADYADRCMLDPTVGAQINWNAGAQRFKGYAAEEIIGQNFSRFYTDADRRPGAATSELLRTAAKEGKFEAEGLRVRERWLHVLGLHVVIDPIRDAAGRADLASPTSPAT